MSKRLLKTFLWVAVLFSKSKAALRYGRHAMHGEEMGFNPKPLEAIMNFKKTAAPRSALTLISFVLLLLVSMAPGLRAQVAGTGSIQGIISDPTGSVIPNAAVTIVEKFTGVRRSTKTDNSGVYIFPNIAIGTYNVTITAKGFETYVRTDNVLEVGSNISIDVSMTVGSETATVEVRTDSLALQTEDVAYKQTIDSAQMVEMPLNGRQITALVNNTGGVSTNGSGGDFTGSKYSYANQGAVSVAGSMGNSTLWRLDGADNSDYMAGGNLPYPFPDAVAQFSQESSVLGGDKGMHSGGMVNAVTRSGTNAFHGDGFVFARNNFIDATSFGVQSPCVPAAGQSSCKDTLHQWQYGGTIGGPVWFPKLYNGKDRLFFFAGFQYNSYKQAASTSNAYVPTPANVAGDFHLTAPPPGPGQAPGASSNGALCGSKVTQLVDPATGNLVPGNIYPAGQVPAWNAQSLALLKYLPAIKPLPDGTDACGHVQYVIPSQNFDKQFITRVDYTIDATNHLYGRYMLDSYQNPAYFYPDNILVTTNTGNPEERVWTGTVGEDHTFSTNLVNSAHIAVLRRLNNRGYKPDAITACDLGVSMLCGASAGLNLGTGSGANQGSFSMGGSTNSLAHFNDNTLVIDDDVTWVHGKHLFFFGGEFVRNQLNISNAFNSNGTFSFGSNYSSYGPYGSKNQAASNPEFGNTNAGSGALDFLEGAMSGFSQSKQQQNALRSTIPALYFQDVFHATKRLTLVAGLRWDPNFEPIDVFNRGATFSFANFAASKLSSVYPNAPAGVSFYGDPGVPRAFTQNSPNQWDPNLGFSYDPFGSGKTVLRAGAEYLYDTPNTFTLQRNQQNPPFATSVNQSLNSYTPFSSPWSAPAVTGGPGATTTSSILANPFPTSASFVGRPSAATAIFPKGGQWIVPVTKYHAAAYMQWTASVQQDFGHNWLFTIQYNGSRGTHEELGIPLDPVLYIPGVSSGVAGPANCNVSVGSVNYYLGEPGASAVPKAGSNCSTTGNSSNRYLLTLENPAQGVYFAGAGTSQYISDTGFSTYEGMVVSVNHRLSAAFSLTANYTWSKNLDILDNMGDISGVNLENPNNPRMDYGPSTGDLRNAANIILIAKSTYNFSNRAERLILNNWEFAGLNHMQSGNPFSVVPGSDISLTGLNNDRASQIPGQSVYIHSTAFKSGAGAANRQWLNPAAFDLTPTTTPPTSPVSLYGNTGKNAFVTPGEVYFDCQVSRFWQLHERLNLDTRIEAYNALNHPNFNTAPTNNVTSGTFGQINTSGIGGPRVFQGAIKIIF